jgi:hypothetical protein
MNKFWSSWLFKVLLLANAIWFVVGCPALLLLYIGLFVPLKSFLGDYHWLATTLYVGAVSSGRYVGALIILFNLPLKFVGRPPFIQKRFSQRQIDIFSRVYDIYFALLFLCMIFLLLIRGMVFEIGEYPNR